MTSYGEDFDELSQQIDQIKFTTERIVSNVEAMVQPHPGNNYYSWYLLHIHVYVSCTVLLY